MSHTQGRPRIAFNAIDPCARISDHNLDSRWWSMLESSYHLLGLGMSSDRELDVEERLIRQSRGLVIACATPEGEILPGFASHVVYQIKRAAELGKGIYAEAPLKECLRANQERMYEADYMFAVDVLERIREVVIGNDISKIRQEVGV